MSSCAKIGKYSVTDSTVNQYLSVFIGKPQSFNAGDLGDAQITFNELNAVIGKEGSDKVNVSGKLNIAITSFLGKLSTDVALTLDARPVYDKEKGAIFLKDLAISDYTIGDKAGASESAFIMPYINKIIQLYFDSQPIYTLKAENSTLEALVLKTGATIKVEDGKIVFSLIEESA